MSATALNARCLLRSLGTIKIADSDPVRKSLFASLSSRSVSVKFALSMFERWRGSYLGAAFVGLYGLKTFLCFRYPRSKSARPRILSVGVFANEKTQLAFVSGLLPAGVIARVDTSKRALFSIDLLYSLLQLMRNLRLVGMTLRVLRQITRRESFLVACRSASTMAFYFRVNDLLNKFSFDAVLVSSDSNPEPIALANAARSQRRKTIFVSHALTTPVSPPLDFDLAILEGKAALKEYLKKGRASKSVVYRGVEGDSKPMRADGLMVFQPTIGLFPPKEIRWDKFRQVIDDCLHVHNAKRVLIRWHPNMLEEPKFPDDVRIETSDGSLSVADVALQCDWTISSESSNVHLAILKSGIPSLAVGEFTVLPPERADLYYFCANSIIPQPFGRPRDIVCTDVAAFFGSAEWVERFRDYDGGYMRPIEQVHDEVRTAIVQLARLPM